MKKCFAVTLLLILLGCGNKTSPSPSVRSEQQVAEYTDNVYNFAFQYPSDWKMQKPPPMSETGGIRVHLKNPSIGNTVMVTISNLGKSITKDQFNNYPQKDSIVNLLINFTIEQVYNKTSRDIQATRMVVSEKKIINSEVGIEFYISTLHFVKVNQKEVPTVVAGIHAIPFDKDYMISFIIMSILDPNAKKENETLTEVFNSFHLIGEKPAERK